MEVKHSCPTCQKFTLIPVDDIELFNQVKSYTCKGLRCTQCGEEIITEEEGKRIIELAKKRGEWKKRP